MVGSTLLYSSSKEGWLDRAGFFRFSNPVLSVKFYKNRLIINGKVINTDNPLPLIQKFINRRFYVTGFVSYDLKDYTLKTQKKPKKGLKLPLIYLNFYKKFEIFTPPQPDITNLIKKVCYNTPENVFVEKVVRAKRFIEEGDIYQINLSHRIDLEGLFFPLNAFFKLVTVQPAPFMMYIVDRDFRLISGSMELFLKKEGKKLISIPIKGTCPKDQDYRQALLNNPKEKAENLMITDLMRNDIGRVCRDIKVEKLFEVKEYSTLYQMSSTVSGRLERDLTLREILEALFPPGSVTGAPKRRAVEIIEELEDTRRDIYCGATLLIKPDLDFTMSVAIRQMIFKRDFCHLFVGAGIVADSQPEKEYQETLLKAEASLRSLTL